MDECNPDYKNATWAYYRYIPTLGAAILFVVLFGIATIIHGYQMIRTRTWYLSAFFAGGVCKLMFPGRRYRNLTEEDIYMFLIANMQS